MSKKKIAKLYQNQVKKATSLLIPKYKPEKIILYGSAARGDFKAGSDIDLLIIKKTKKTFLKETLRPPQF